MVIKKILVYLLTYIVALVLGGCIAAIGGQFDAMSWLAFSPEFGFEPFSLNLIVIRLTFGMHIKISVAQIIMLVVAIFVAPKVVSTLVAPKK